MTDDVAETSVTVSYRRVMQPAPYESIEAAVSWTRPASKTANAAKKQAEGLMGDARSVVEGEYGLRLGEAAKAETAPAAEEKPAEAAPAAEEPVKEEPKAEEPTVDLDLPSEEPAKEVSDADFKKFLVEAMQKVSGAKVAEIMQADYGTTSAAAIPTEKRAEFVAKVTALL